MSKNTLFIVIVLAAVILGAGGLLVYQAANVNKNQSTENAAMTVNQDGNKLNAGSDNTDIFKQALMGNTGIECRYSDEMDRSMVSYVKNGQVRADMVSDDPEESGSVIVKNRVYYSWNATKKGYKMELPEIDVQKPDKDKMAEDVNSGDRVISDIEKYKNNCKISDFPDSVFDVPEDVVFQDMSQMMKMVPTGMTAPSGMPAIDQAKIEEMMKQYQQDTP